MASGDELRELRTIVSEKLKSHLRGQRCWSFVHHGVLFSAAILTGIAGVLAPLLETGKVPTVLLGSVATIITSISAAGGFQHKWQRNRLTASALEQLSLDIMTDDAAYGPARERLKQIIDLHNKGITGVK